MNFNNIMKQAQAMQKKMEEAQAQVANQEFEGMSGGGAVKIIINGKVEMVKVTIDPELANKDEVEILEDLIIAAFNDAKRKYDDESKNSMSGLMSGMPLPPGMKMPF